MVCQPHIIAFLLRGGARPGPVAVLSGRQPDLKVVDAPAPVQTLRPARVVNAIRRYGFLPLLLLILTLTLLPERVVPDDGLLPENLSADFGRNILLFLPLGFMLAVRGMRLGHAIIAGFLISSGIELLQVMIPGRDPSLLDVCANSLGAAARRAALAWPTCLEQGARVGRCRRGVRAAGSPRWDGTAVAADRSPLPRRLDAGPGGALPGGSAWSDDRGRLAAPVARLGPGRPWASGWSRTPT